MRLNTPTRAAAAVAAISGLLSASLLRTATAHHTHRVDCFASSEGGFDYQVTAADNFMIYWTVDTANEEITFQAVYDGEGWISVGFSDTGRMVVADAVIGLPDEATALEYFLTNKHVSGTIEAETQEISGASVTQVDSTTSLVFTRPLSPFDTEKEVFSAERGDEATFIWGYGKENVLATHSHHSRGAVTLVDLFCGEAVEDDSDNEVDNEDDNDDADADDAGTDDGGKDDSDSDNGSRDDAGNDDAGKDDSDSDDGGGDDAGRDDAGKDDSDADDSSGDDAGKDASDADDSSSDDAGVDDAGVDADTASTALCASSDPDYNFEISPRHDLALLWGVIDGGMLVKVKAVYEGEGWLSIGFSDRGRMRGSDAVIGLPADDSVLEYDMDDYNRPDEALEQEISNATITQVSGVTTLTFVRPLQPEGDGKQLLSASGESVWIYAWGRSNTFVEHVVDGRIVFTLDSCSTQTPSLDVSVKQYAHAWLMVIGWSVCFPVGIIFARFSNSFAEFGFFVHRGLQTLGTVLAFAGFFVAVSFTEDSGSEHYDSPHGLLGIVLMIFLMLQVVAAVFRPSAQPMEAPIVQQPEDQVVPKPAPASIVRRAWSLSHKAFGYIAIVVAGIQCLGGFNLLDIEEKWWMLYSLLVSVTVVAFSLLQFMAFNKPKPIHYVGVELSGSQLHATTGTTYDP